MPPKKKDDKKGAKKEDPADALANQLEGERQNLVSQHSRSGDATQPAAE